MKKDGNKNMSKIFDKLKPKPQHPLPPNALSNEEIKHVIAERLIVILGLQPVKSGYNFGTLYFGDKKFIEAISAEIVLFCIGELQKKVDLDLRR